MKKTIEYIRRIILSQLTKDTSIVLLGNLFSSVLAVVFTILAARTLGPEGWGIVAAVGSLITILVAFSDLGIGAGLFRFLSAKWSRGEKREASRIIQVAFSIRVISALVFVGILILFSGPISQLILHSADPRLSMFTALGMLGSLLIDFHITLVEAKREWKRAAFFIATTNSLRVSFLLFATLSDRVNFGSVLLIFTSSPVIASFIAFLIERTGFELAKDWNKIFKEIGVFSGIMGVNKIVSSINSRVDVLLIVNLLGAYEAGIYAAANRLAIGVPIILGSFATVLAPRFSAFSEKSESLKFFKRAMSLAAFICLGLIVGIIIAPFVTSLFGPEFERSGIVLQFLLSSFIPAVFAVPAVNLVIYGVKKPQIITLLSIFQFPVILFINFYFMPGIGVFAPVLALAVVNTMTMIVTFFAAWRHYHKK